MYKTTLKQNGRTSQLILIQHAVLVIIFMSLYMRTIVNISLWTEIDLIQMVHIKPEMLIEEETGCIIVYFEVCSCDFVTVKL
jgi:hypothetical protein